MSISSRTIVDLLSVKHSQDVFVPECKNGPTSYGEHLRLDAWVMKKSWANPLVTGYEIKVSRSDFLQDEKWRGYLPYCNEFYFVAPAGLIDPSELDADVGLLSVSKTGTKLFKKKRAAYREVDIPEEIFRYILMARCLITREYRSPDKLAYWRQWLKEKADRQSLGWEVSKAIRDAFNDQKRRNDRLQKDIEDLKGFKEILLKHGFNPDSTGWAFENKLEELKAGIPKDFLRNLKNVQDIAGELLERLNDQ